MAALFIEAIYITGSSLYVITRGVVNGVKKVWNPTLNAGAGAWATFSGGAWAQYAMAMVEDTGTGYYAVAYPANASAILTTEVIYVQGGGSPVVGDSPVSFNRSQGSNVVAVAKNVQAGSNLGASTGSMQVGTLTGTPTATLLPTDLTAGLDGVYAGRSVIMTSGDLIQQVAFITVYDATTFTLTTRGFPSGFAPNSGDSFVIV